MGRVESLSGIREVYWRLIEADGIFCVRILKGLFFLMVFMENEKKYLKCPLEKNVRRAQADNRDEERIKRGIANTFHFYDEYEYPSIDTTDMTPEQVQREL